jgi:phosphoglycerol transferase MdoB-like AlkP superfamily enzyme
MAQNNHGLSNTVFVILADHCASAGKTELVDKYRIPAMIYSPGFAPAQYTNLMSQIDVMPTVSFKF